MMKEFYYEVDFADNSLFHKNHEYVDLGLPSRTKWATCNIGSSRPQDSGMYFEWGETSCKSRYVIENYEFCDSENRFTYNGSKDVANEKWGGRWRVPSKEQFEELRLHCNWYWLERGNVVGFLVTSKCNSNSIFLPAAGYKRYSGFFDFNKVGVYWSATLSDKYSDSAYGFQFRESNVLIDQDMRFHGKTIRPVMKL